MLGNNDCLRACIAVILNIPPKDLPNPTQEYRKLKIKQKNIVSPDWLDFFNSIYQFWGFKLNYTKNTKGLTIGVVAPKRKAHAIVCKDGLPFHNPDPGGKSYQKNEVGYYIRVKRIKGK